MDGSDDDVKRAVNKLGKKVDDTDVPTPVTLSSGVKLISKPSKLHVPPWQMVSALLGGEALRAATWWTRPAIYSTTKSTKISCWNADLDKPGAVEIATTGAWDGTAFSLEGGPSRNHNHAKIGVSKSGQYAIFGDLNQQGAIADTCGSSQNGRGGLFFVVEDTTLATDIRDRLIKGKSAGTSAPN